MLCLIIMPKEFDFIVIGGGSGGYAGARTAAEHGAKVAVIDSASDLGGLCILRGCMPSKTLLYATEIAHRARQGKTFGLEIPSVKVDMAALQERKRKLIGEFQQYRVEGLESGRFTLYRSKARFRSRNEIQLDDGTILKGRGFLIATGSVVQWPDIPGLSESGFWTSDEVLDLDTLPESIVVLGGGIVACELSQFLSRAGVKVTIIQRSPRLLTGVSPEASEVLLNVFREEGITVHLNTQIEKIERNDKILTVTFTENGEPRTVTAAEGFNALGRIPNTQNLFLAGAQVDTLPNGRIATNANQQTNQPHIYAAGDCTGPHEIVHLAVQQGENAAKHFLKKPFHAVDYDQLLIGIFTDPQIAFVGLSTEQLKKRNLPYIDASYPFNDHGKSLLMEALHGYVRILGHANNGRILGAEVVGPEACELIHTLAIPLSMRASVKDLLKAPWYHPTLSEIWTYPLEEIQEQLD